MIERMSHDEYVLSGRARAAEIADSVISGSLPILDGCHLLNELRGEIEVPDNDPDFQVFALVYSETDSLPIGSLRENWAPEALAKSRAELQSATDWAGRIALPACKSVVSRFGA